MKKSKLAAALLCSMCLIAGNTMPAMADAVKVVTLGADLTEEQKETMLRYFKVNRNDVQILTITNQDERDHLSAYVPLEQIGTRTVSSAYVKPTQSGGIKVRTANLNWVTCNMIATTLSTSGVKNCEVIAACPFEVSGTGALTGIQMAYETASGEELDETKKQIATEEMVLTGKLADEVGQNDATSVINKAKMEIIQNNIQDADEIYNIVINIADEIGVSLTEEQIDEIVQLLAQISEQDYDYEEMKDTLERVDDNVSGDLEEQDDTVDVGDIVDDADDDSILDDIDDSILGDDVISGSTEDTLDEITTGGSDDDAEWTDPSYGEEGEDGTEDWTEDDEWTEEIPEDGEDWTEEVPEEDDDTVEVGDVVEEPSEELDTTLLTEDQLTYFNKAKTFFKGEYTGDAQALQEAMGEDAISTVYLGEETAAALTKEVEKAYYDIFVNGTDSYVADGTEMYMSTELNMMDKELQRIFGLDENGVAIDALYELSDEDKQTLYNDTLKFFEKLYGEETSAYEDASLEEMPEGEEMEAELEE